MTSPNHPARPALSAAHLMQHRLRQLLGLLAGATAEWTTELSDQGDFLGHDQFVGVGLIENAKALLIEWDEEDAGRAALAAEGAGRYG